MWIKWPIVLSEFVRAEKKVRPISLSSLGEKNVQFGEQKIRRHLESPRRPWPPWLSILFVTTMFRRRSYRKIPIYVGYLGSFGHENRK